MFNGKQFFSSTLILLSLIGLAPSLANAVVPEHGRALSVRVLQERIKVCQASGRCKQEVNHLAFLRRIDGFVIDRENADLILIGQVDPTWPKLHLEYLVIALRDAWHRYATRKGNTLYISSPGVSIDPVPRVIARLQEVGNSLNSAASKSVLDQGLEKWHRVCHLPQNVRVEGIPFHTRSAAIMLDVDYDLKRITDNSIELDIEGFKSLTSRYLDAAKQAINTRTAPRLSTMSRFWFYPKRLQVRADDNAAIIDPGFGVKVLTEEEHLNARGQIVGKGHANPSAADFAQAVSKFYPEIAKLRPSWRELENLAWMVALTRTMRHRNALQHANLDIDWLMDDYEQPIVMVQKTVPGHSNVQSYDYRLAVQGGYVVGSLRLPSCGGVELNVKVDSGSFLPPKRQVKAAYKNASRKRPSPDALYWDF